jgi:steroid delta-isomerase-like uncharacterized protein
MADTTALNVASQYSAAMAAQDSDTMHSLHSSDFVLDFIHGDAFESDPISSEQTGQFWPAWFAGFPEMDYEVTRTIAGETVIVTQWIFTGTHGGTLGNPVFENPIEPTGRTIRFRGVSIYDIHDGRILRETTYMDLATLMVELGME